jgi:hypothetical protein
MFVLLSLFLIKEGPRPTSFFFKVNWSLTQGGSSQPLPPLIAKADRNHWNDEITPLLPTGIGERYSQTISNLGQAALLRRCELPLYKRKC